MKIGVHYQALGRNIPFERGFSFLGACGVQGAELVMREGSPLFSKETPEKELRRICRLAEGNGLCVSGVTNADLWTYPLTSGSAFVRQRGLDSLRRQIDAAAILGAEKLLVIPGYAETIFVPHAETVPSDTACARALEGLRHAALWAEAAGVSLCVENVWNGMLLSPEELAGFVDAPASPAVGVYFDMGNALRYGLPQRWIARLGSRIRAVHVKDALAGKTDMRAFPPMGEGDVDFPACIDALQRVGYDGFYTIETHGDASFESVERSVRFLRELLGND